MKTSQTLLYSLQMSFRRPISKECFSTLVFPDFICKACFKKKKVSERGWRIIAGVQIWSSCSGIQSISQQKEEYGLHLCRVQYNLLMHLYLNVCWRGREIRREREREVEIVKKTRSGNCQSCVPCFWGRPGLYSRELGGLSGGGGVCVFLSYVCVRRELTEQSSEWRASV